MTRKNASTKSSSARNNEPRGDSASRELGRVMLHDGRGGDKHLSQVELRAGIGMLGIVLVSPAHPFYDVLSSGEKKKKLFDTAIDIPALNTLLIVIGKY